MNHTRKLLSLALALVMCLSLMPMTAFAATNDEMYQSAQILNSANGDGTTPFNLQWVDGANGLISFDVQTDDLYDSTGMVGTLYMVYVFRDGVNTGEEAVSSRNVGGTATADISAHMDINGSYEFLVCYSGMGSPIGEIAKSTPYPFTNGEETPAAPTATDFEYVTNSTGGIDITGYNGNSPDVVIPSEIDGKSVTHIGSRAFWDEEITSVTIPDSVQSILSEAFWNCENLTTVNMSKNTKFIGQGAFDGCTSLANIEIPEGIERIQNVAFRNCTSLTNVTIPASITDKTAASDNMESIFSGCMSLQKVVWKSEVTTQTGAFYNCPSLTELYVYDGYALHDSAFAYLGSYEFPPNLTIYSTPNARAHNIATQYNINFVPLDANATATAPITPTQPTTPVQPTAPIIPVQPTVPAQQSMTVIPTPSKVFVNGMEISFEAYHIDGSNYFKLRDIAFVLNGTIKQFNLGYDNATAAITLLPGQPYIPAGGEMAAGNGQAKPATLTASKIYLNGQELNFTVYNIAGSNFFKLVDLMSVLNVGVTYNQTTGSISIDTNANFMGVITVSEPTIPTPAPTIPAPITTPAPITPSAVLNAGDFVRAEIASDDSSARGNVATNVWGFRVAAAGNLENGPEPNISDVKLFIDGTETPVSYESGSRTYHANRDQTTFNYSFDQEFTQKPAKYWVEMTVNGETVQSRITNWRADGVVEYE